MSDFVTLLRSLDAAASKAPWSVDYVALYDAEENWIGDTYECEDAALLVLLRNRAARIAALVEAAGAVLEKAGVSYRTHGNTYTVPAERIDALRAKLAALDKEEA